MRRLSLSLALGVGVLTACIGTALADPVFNFTVTGDGQTFQFSLPNPATITDHPHALNIYYGPVAGTVDGVSGYTFTSTFIAETRGYAGADFTFSVAPVPAGSTLDGTYALFGPILFTLVSDVPNPMGNIYDGDLLTFAFVPGDYSFSGLGATGAVETYSVDIAEEAAVTPEPGTWILWLTGAAMLAVGLGRLSSGFFPSEQRTLSSSHPWWPSSIHF